jgi:hypothetical protein
MTERAGWPADDAAHLSGSTGDTPHYSERVIEQTLSLRPKCVSMKARDHVMRHAMFTTVRSRLMPLAALLLATALGGCVGYSSYPSRDYSYSYPSSYYAGYPRTYNGSYGYRPYYSPGYGRYETGGGGQ